MTNEMNQTQTTETTELVEVPFEVPEGWRLVSDEESEALARQIVEDHRENWEVQEIIDSAIAAGEMNELLRNEFYYEYTQGGRKVRGLTAKMIAHLATARSITEEIGLRKYVETDDAHEFEVVVSIPDAFHPDGKLYRSGFAEEPKVLGGKPDKFAKIKAYTKAFRRACEKLLPQDLLMAATYKLAKLVPADWQPPARQPKALPAPVEQTPIEKAMKACFAIFGEKEADLAKRGIGKKDFWDALGKILGVKSRDDMTLEQWNLVQSALNEKDYGQIVKDVIAKVTEAKQKESKAKGASTDESEIPF